MIECPLYPLTPGYPLSTEGCCVVDYGNRPFPPNMIVRICITGLRGGLCGLHFADEPVAPPMGQGAESDSHLFPLGRIRPHRAERRPIGKKCNPQRAAFFGGALLNPVISTPHMLLCFLVCLCQFQGNSPLNSTDSNPNTQAHKPKAYCTQPGSDLGRTPPDSRNSFLGSAHVCL